MSTTLRGMLPECILLISIIVGTLLDVASSPHKKRGLWVCAGIFSALIVAVFSMKHRDSVFLFSNTLLIDPISSYFRVLGLVSASFTCLMIGLSKRIVEHEKLSMQVLTALATLSFSVLVMAVHLGLLYFALLGMSVPLFCLAAFMRFNARSSEAGMKFFFHSSWSVLFLALGIVVCFGLGQSFNLFEIHQKMIHASAGIGGAADQNIYYWIVFGLFFAAAAGLMGAFPFSFLVPDFIEGAPIAAAAFFSSVPVLAGLYIIIRMGFQLFSVRQTGGDWVAISGIQWPQFIEGVAALTMTVASLSSIFQSNIKRILAFLTLLNVGYVFLGFAVVNVFGLSAALFSLAANLLAALGCFIVSQWVSDQREVTGDASEESMTVYRGLVSKNPLAAVSLCVFLVALVGIPPFAGFIGRFSLIASIFEKKIYWLAIIASMNWVVALYVVLRMIHQVLSNERSTPESKALVLPPIVSGSIIFLLLPTVMFGLFWNPIMQRIRDFFETIIW